MKSKKAVHCPVLLKQSIDLLAVKKGGLYIDATVGAGGHAAEILKRGGQLLGFDLDKQMLKLAKAHLESACPNGPWQLKQANFRDLALIANQMGFGPVRGILFDLGLSSFHYRKARRGFSFQDQVKLDMRISNQGETANALLKQVSQKKLTQILQDYAQEPLAVEIAQAIIKERGRDGLTAARLARLIEEIYFLKGRGRTKTHPATRTFLALRLWVNKEAENLKAGLKGGLSVLKTNGRLVIISFHSGEDRIVKQQFKKWQKEKRGKALTPTPIFPDSKEIKENPLSRSAVLRGFKKTSEI